MTNLVTRALQFLRGLFSICRSHADVTMENILLRQQLIALKKENPRPRLTKFDRLFWVLIRRAWHKWKHILIMVRPETVIRWHRMGFKLFWRFISNQAADPEKALLKKDMRRLIHKMASENSSWGAPRIHGELLKLGFRISERTVSRYMPRREPSREKIQRWLAFLHNHRPVIAAMDFFVVHTLFFRQLYCFFIIGHDMRTIIHMEATFHPTADWIRERLMQLFSRGHSLKYMVYDRDGIFSPFVTKTLKALGIDPIRTSYRSPWQNGIAERFIGSVRSELLDQVIVFNEKHLLRLMKEYIDYYHNDRTHYALNKDSPKSRPLENKPSDNAKVIALPRLGGLHHRYVWKDVA